MQYNILPIYNNNIKPAKLRTVQSTFMNLTNDYCVQTATFAIILLYTGKRRYEWNHGKCRLKLPIYSYKNSLIPLLCLRYWADAFINELRRKKMHECTHVEYRHHDLFLNVLVYKK